MDETKSTKIDTIVKVVGALVAVAGGVLALLQYRSVNADQLKAQQMAFVNQRLDILTQATGVAAALQGDIEGNAQKTDDAVSRFWDFYNSKSVFIEGPDIHKSVKGLLNALMALNDTKHQTYVDLGKAAHQFALDCEHRVDAIQKIYGGDWLVTM